MVPPNLFRVPGVVDLFQLVSLGLFGVILFLGAFVALAAAAGDGEVVREGLVLSDLVLDIEGILVILCVDFVFFPEEIVVML